MNQIADFFAAWGDSLWTATMVPVVVVVGLYLTWRTGFVQVRLFRQMIKTLSDKTPKDDEGNDQSISSFQAFTVSAASRVGVGNIAGVGTAIMVGGPGAVFWMWVMAIIGGASSFIESTLGQAYKVRDKDGFRGGPAYYIQKGLGSRDMGIIFAIVITFCFPFAFNSLQANTISFTIAKSSGFDPEHPGATGSVLMWGIGIALAILTGLVIFGGIRRIATVTDKLVPVMAGLYLLVGLVIVGMNIQHVPSMFVAIVSDAFTVNSVTGGAIGTVIMAGVKRGMFSNEAGLGSAPNAGATAAVTHPVKQGLVQTLGVYFDTLLICSITAFIILASQQDPSSVKAGVDLTYNAMTGALGPWSGWLLVVIIFMLAFSSIIGNYYYGESNVEYMSTKPVALTVFRVIVVLAVLAGAVVKSDLVWNLADAIMGVMALINLFAIALLAKPAVNLLKDYQKQLKEGKDPVFTKDRVSLPGEVDFWNNEHEVTGLGAKQPVS